MMSEHKQLNKTGIYLRLSKDDERLGESLSIDNQRLILRNYVLSHGGTIVDEYIDDGYSGTNFERPGVKRLLEDAQMGKITYLVSAETISRSDSTPIISSLPMVSVLLH